MSQAGARAQYEIAALADQCVRCGLCLPHCPSYRTTREEGDSPRGRIAFARALALDEALGPALTGHLDRCLACGVCEDVCPSGVRYDELIGRTRALPGGRGRHRTGAGLRFVLRHPRLLRVALGLVRLARRVVGPGRIGKLSATLGSLVAHAGDVRAGAPPVAYTPAAGERRGAVALFRGCAAAVLDADTQRAAAEVLSRLGYDVHAPRESQCCGALARHAGATTEAERSAHATGESLAALPISTVLGTA